MADQYNAIGAAVSAANALLKVKYGDLHKMLIDQFKMQKTAKFSESKKIGDSFQESIMLQGENGITYAGSDEDAFALDDARAGHTEFASIKGAQHVIRALVGFNAVSRSAGSEAAFESVFDVVVGNTNDSIRKRIEIDMLYGQKPIGIVESVANTVVTLKAASFAPGIWAGLEGAQCQFFAPSGATGDADPTSTFRNDGGALSASAYGISAVNLDPDVRTVTFDTDLDSISTPVAANDVICFKGQFTGSAWKTQLGLHSITGQTTGNLFGVSTDYSLWKPSQFDCTGGTPANELSFEKVNKATYRTISKGFTGDQCLKVNPNTWADLLEQEAAVRRHSPMTGGRITVGSDGIKFVCAEGTIRIESSIYVKEGYAYLIPESGTGSYKRVGSTDVTMRPLGGKGDATFLERVQGVSAYEMLMYDNQALYTSRPAYSLQLNGIVNG